MVWHNPNTWFVRTDNVDAKSMMLSTKQETRGDQFSMKMTPLYVRMDPQYLELAYKEFGLMATIVDKTVQVIMSTDRRIKGKSSKFFESFLEEIGLRGGEEHWGIILNRIFAYQFIYGCCPVELIRASSGEIVDLAVIDPKRFDYAKNGMNPVALDENQNPYGYTQLFMYGTFPKQKAEPPPEVVLMSNQIYIPARNVALFKLYDVGDGFYPSGFVERGYKSAIRLKAGEEDLANAIWRTGHPILCASIGDENHDATPEQIENGVKQLEDLNARHSLAFAYYNKLILLEPKGLAEVREALNYHIEQICTAMGGIPMAFATGKGEATNRSTLNRQEYMWKLTLKGIVEKTTQTMESKIFYEIAKSYNETHYNNKITPPKLIWGEIVLEEMDSKAQRIANYLKTGGLTPYKELEEWIRSVEGLPEPMSEESMRPAMRETNNINNMIESIAKDAVKKRG